MGAEWEKDFCPRILYEKAITMDVAMMADIRFLCSKQGDLTTMLTASIHGYQTLKSIMVRHCKILKEDGICNQNLLDFKSTESISRRGQKVREYILENEVLGCRFCVISNSNSW